MYVDMAVCIECGICDEIAPGIRDDVGHVPAMSLTLDAMASCPTGAIKWAEGGTMKRVDVRTIPPRERHPLLFRTFDDLEAGQSFELVNDHDPKPLYYQFQVERAGTVEWEYLEQGPQTWRVRIGKVA